MIRHALELDQQTASYVRWQHHEQLDAPWFHADFHSRLAGFQPYRFSHIASFPEKGKRPDRNRAFLPRRICVFQVPGHTNALTILPRKN